MIGGDAKDLFYRMLPTARPASVEDKQEKGVFGGMGKTRSLKQRHIKGPRSLKEYISTISNQTTINICEIPS